MNESYFSQVENSNPPLSMPMIERMDSAIGETSAVVGGMMTEFLRRSMRSSVLHVFEQLQTVVSDKVDATLAERTPAIEQLAAQVAEHTARTAATEVATEEVRALEQRTQESSRTLADRIQESSQQLSTQIGAAEKKAATAHSEISQQVQDLLERSRKAAAYNKARLEEVEHRTQGLEISLRDEIRKRNTALTALRANWQKHLEVLQQEQARLRQTSEQLAARLTELEKPRGLSGLWKRMFPGKERGTDSKVQEE
jgi:chromosome segregation ATPase